MKHFRILEIKGEKKHYTIQYIVNIFFGLHYWKTLNNKKYYKYDDALTHIKDIIQKSDYDTYSIVYHYIDAYKLFKHKNI